MAVPEVTSPEDESTACWFAQTPDSPLPKTFLGFNTEPGPDELHDLVPTTVQTSSTTSITTFSIRRARITQPSVQRSLDWSAPKCG